MKPSELNLSMYSGFSEAIRLCGIEEAARRAADMGFSSVELLETAKNPSAGVIPNVECAHRAREILVRYGLSLSCYSLGARLWSPNASAEQTALQEARLFHFAEVAAALGSPFFHHTLAPAYDDTPYQAVFDAVLPFALRVVDHAESLGLTVLYEPQGRYFNGSEGFGRIYRAVKAERPRIGVCGDIGNTVFVDEDPAIFFGEYAGEIRHVHLKDYYLHTENGDPTKHGFFVRAAVIGEGNVDIPACLSLLRAAGYTGAFAIEHDVHLSLQPSCRLLKQHFYA